eukprot:CAMPEP_0117060318 /NCGR_PEP_ID=MMETSP0472-20121206/41922_1 /TAXON_ID=693140 ORGANISM="Tiarina fusus, Strain LIS" /NCGR_SAMPLE_ID=MMETSP0472 /ASSEMBLY_ACC=CAM_ASM_000603 /LENGTH=70 /DNA_ID=CAMNT_0004778415 /DNA_START=161 /DNA_END=374 /DNA_ORIENTATION=-
MAEWEGVAWSLCLLLAAVLFLTHLFASNGFGRNTRTSQPPPQPEPYLTPHQAMSPSQGVDVGDTCHRGCG